MAIPILFFCLGASFGSFLTLAAVRSVHNQDWIRSRSRCDHCKKPLGFFDLVPILSFLVFGGKSRCCRKKLSYLYPLSEMVVGLAFAFTAGYFFPFIHIWSGIQFIGILTVISFLWIIFVTDFRFEVIPTYALVGALTAGFSVLFLRSSACVSLKLVECTTSLVPALLSGLIPALLFFFLWFFSHGKAMGDGDISLVFVLGFLLGYPSIIVGLYIAFLTGAIVGVILILVQKKTLKSHISFGPFLIAGAGVAALWGAPIIRSVTNMWF